MGKPTGFLEYERTEARSVEPKERIKNFNEFHIFLSKEKQQEQAKEQSQKQGKEQSQDKDGFMKASGEPLPFR